MFMGMKNYEKRFTFRREDTLLVAGAVDELDIELLRDGVNCGDLVRPCAVVDDHAVGVRHVLLVCEEAHSLDECAFYLSESRAVFRAAHFHWRRFCMSSFYLALTWPRSTAGFRLCPQSYMMSLRRIVVAPVRTSISTCDEISNNVSALSRNEAAASNGFGFLIAFAVLYCNWEQGYLTDASSVVQVTFECWIRGPVCMC